jgi:hypothetical protein
MKFLALLLFIYINCFQKASANTICYGYNTTDPSVCSGNGICISTDDCQCKEGYKGYTCNLFSCFGTQNDDIKVCSGNGICSSIGKINTNIDSCKCNLGI